MSCSNHFTKSLLRFSFIALALVAIAVTFKGCSSEDGSEQLVGVWGFGSMEFEFLQDGSGSLSQPNLNLDFRFYLTWSASDGHLAIVYEDGGKIESDYSITSDGSTLTLTLYDWVGGAVFYRRDNNR